MVTGGTFALGVLASPATSADSLGDTNIARFYGGRGDKERHRHRPGCVSNGTRRIFFWSTGKIQIGHLVDGDGTIAGPLFVKP